MVHDEIGFNKLSARWMPKILSDVDKDNRVEISRGNLDRMKSDPQKNFDRIVTQNEHMGSSL